MSAVTEYWNVQFDRAGSHLTVYVDGELDRHSAPLLLGEVQRRIDPATTLVWLDLAAVSFCDCAALAALTRFHEQVSANGTRVKLYQPSRAISRVSELTGLVDMIPTYRAAGDGRAPAVGLNAD